MFLSCLLSPTAVPTTTPRSSSSLVADQPPHTQSEIVHRSASRFTASPTLRALAQECLDHTDDEAVFARFAAELRVTGLVPRVMAAYGHSSSSAAMMYTHEMLEAHGVP